MRKVWFTYAFFMAMSFYPVFAAEVTLGSDRLYVGDIVIRPECFYEYWMDVKKDVIDVKQCSEIKMRMSGSDKQEEYYGENIDYNIIGRIDDLTALELTHYTGRNWNRLIFVKYTPNEQGGTLQIVQSLGQGDRCNMGFGDAAIKNGVLEYTRLYSFADFLYLLDADYNSSLYDKLENRPTLCAASAKYIYKLKEGERLQSVTLDENWIKGDYRKNIFEPVGTSEQLCLEDKLKEFIGQNKQSLGREELRKLGLQLKSKCSPSFLPN
ncbi:MAG: hypothetical protein EYC62_09020 [Alphaproteobacteria bacterium]|nr:MAG: hypothetical protein EYC62_09020 [Alphaproteobacteria bacterium]